MKANIVITLVILITAVIIAFLTNVAFNAIQPYQAHWSKWSAPNQPWSDWNGALQYRTNLDTGVIIV